MTQEPEGGMANETELVSLLKAWKERRARAEANAQSFNRPVPQASQTAQPQPTLAQLGVSREEILKMIQEEVQEAQASASDESLQYTMSVLKNFGMTLNSPKANLGMGEPFRLGR